MKVNHHSSSAAANAVRMLEPVRKHLTDSGCIGSISEIFDGDTPHNPAAVMPRPGVSERYCAATVKIFFLIYNFHFLLDNKGSFL